MSSEPCSMDYMRGSIPLLSYQFIKRAALASSSSENTIHTKFGCHQPKYLADYIIAYTPVRCLRLSGTNLFAVPPARSGQQFHIVHSVLPLRRSGMTFPWAFVRSQQVAGFDDSSRRIYLNYRSINNLRTCMRDTTTKATCGPLSTWKCATRIPSFMYKAK